MSKFVTDGGGNFHGQTRFRHKGNTELWECISCRKRQIEFISSRDRAARVHCKSCGGLAYPVNEFTYKEPEPKRCKKCGKKLRMGNRTGICEPCFASLEPITRANILYKKGKRKLD